MSNEHRVPVHASLVSAEVLMGDGHGETQSAGAEVADYGLRSVRARTAAELDAATLEGLLDKCFNKGREMPPPIRKHLSEAIDDLCRKIEKSLRLKGKIDGLIEQVSELHEGRVPSGIRPFKAAVETNELDTPVPDNLLCTQCN